MARGNGCRPLVEKGWIHVLESCTCSYNNVKHTNCQLKDLKWECKRNVSGICSRAAIAWAEDMINDPDCKRWIHIVEGLKKSCFILKESSSIRGNNVDYEVCHVNIKIPNFRNV